MKASVVQGWPKGTHIRIHLSDVDSSQVNAIRRSLIADVPKMAIHEVRFTTGFYILCECGAQYEPSPGDDRAATCPSCNRPASDGELFESVNAIPDEVLAHRLGMTPVPTFLRGDEHPDGFLFLEDDPNNEGKPRDQWGSPNSQIIYTCRKQGPRRDDPEDHVWVTVGDLQCLSADERHFVDERFASIPLTMLTKGQFLEFYAFAQLGRGRDHAKYEAANAIGFHPREVAVLNDATAAKVLFELNLTTSDGRPIDAKLFDKKGRIEDINTVSDVRAALFQVGYGTGRDAQFNDSITLETVPSEYVLEYETDGSHSPETAFNLALSELEQRVSEVIADLAHATA